MFQIGTVLDSSVTGSDCNRKEAEKAYYFSSGDIIFLRAPRHQAWHFTGHPYLKVPYTVLITPPHHQSEQH